MKKYTLLLSLKGLMTHAHLSAVLITALWIAGMLTALLPVVIAASILSMAWPYVRVQWCRAYRSARATIPQAKRGVQPSLLA